MLEQLLAIDRTVLLWIQENMRSDLFTPFFKLITHLGDSGMIWILLSVFFLLFKKTRKAGFLSLISLAGSFLICNVIIKNAAARVRPYEVTPLLQLLIERQKDFSFPSGHASSSFASAVVLLKTLPKKIGIPCMILAILIAISRLYVGVHYPSDVLAGILIGTMIALLTLLFSKKC